MEQQLTPSIVRILTRDGNTAGTGFVVTGDGLIATCAHVVHGAGASVGEAVELVFQQTGERRTTDVVPNGWRAPGAEDVAILRLRGGLPEGVAPLPLGSSTGSDGHAFRTFGYPQANPVGGLLGEGQLLGEITLGAAQVLQISSAQVILGFSGAPVFDDQAQRVVGMVTAIAAPDHGRLAETAFVTPTEVLQAACPALVLADLCPYQSLDHFTEEQEAYFCGRRGFVDTLVGMLRNDPCFLAVVGPSGSGKSSLVRAGLVPRLRQGALRGSEHWPMVIFDHPAAAAPSILAAPPAAATLPALGEPPPPRRVVVLDQFEELFVGQPSADGVALIQALTKCLQEPSEALTVILTLRDDFLSRITLEAPSLMERVQRRLAWAPSTLAEADLTAIVQEPALALGLRFEDDLVRRIVGDMIAAGGVATDGTRAGRAAMLPLLEFTLTELWRRRQAGCLTHASFVDCGGVTGGLQEWARRTYASLGPTLQPLARRVLRDLVHLGDERLGLPDTRQRRPTASLWRDASERAAVEHVLQRLADARLVVLARDDEHQIETVELTHDVLLRQWDLLREWPTHERVFLAWRQQVEPRVREWVASADDPSRRDDLLLRGVDVREAEQQRAYAEQNGRFLSQVECDYLDASRAAERGRGRARALGHVGSTAFAVALGYGGAFALAFSLLAGAATEGPQGGTIVDVLLTFLLMCTLGALVGCAIGLGLGLPRRAPILRLAVAGLLGAAAGGPVYLWFFDLALSAQPNSFAHDLIAGMALGAGLGVGAGFPGNRRARVAAATFGGLLGMELAIAISQLPLQQWWEPLLCGLAAGGLTGIALLSGPFEGGRSRWARRAAEPRQRGPRWVLFLTFAVAFLAGCGGPAPFTVDQATLSTERVEVSVQRPGGAATAVPEAKPATVVKGDAISIGGVGQGLLDFRDCLQVMVYREVNLSLAFSSNIDPKAPPLCGYHLRAGAVFNAVGIKAAANRRIQVETDAAVIAATGTKFFVYYDVAAQTAWVVTTEGTVSVSAAGQTVRVGAGSQTWVVRGQPPQRPMPATRAAVGTRFPPIDVLTNGAIRDGTLLTPLPTATATATATPRPTSSPTPRASSTPPPTPTRTPTPTSSTWTPAPTWTPTPTLVTTTTFSAPSDIPTSTPTRVATATATPTASATPCPPLAINTFRVYGTTAGDAPVWVALWVAQGGCPSITGSLTAAYVPPFPETAAGRPASATSYPIANYAGSLTGPDLSGNCRSIFFNLALSNGAGQKAVRQVTYARTPCVPTKTPTSTPAPTATPTRTPTKTPTPTPFLVP